jgi:hypothetical protein
VDRGAEFLSWLIRNRRLSKDYERMVQTSETLIEVATIRLILRRLVGGSVNLTKQALILQCHLYETTH